MNVKMKMHDNDYDDVRPAGFQQNTQYARSLTWRRHNMPIHTIAPSPPLHSYTSTIHTRAPLLSTHPYIHNSHN